MKSLLGAAALLVVATSAFADHTRYVAPRATAPLVAPARTPSRFQPYTRNEAHLPARAVSRPIDASSRPASSPAPYNRSNPRFTAAKA